MKIRIHMIKDLADHTSAELDSLSQRTILSEAGSSSMYNEIHDVRNHYSSGRKLTVYHFRTNNIDVGWVALVTYTTPGRKFDNEIWTFVVPDFRRKGIGTQMINIVQSTMTTEQKSNHYRVFGFHSSKAHQFYTKIIKLHETMNVRLI